MSIRTLYECNVCGAKEVRGKSQGLRSIGGSLWHADPFTKCP